MGDFLRLAALTSAGNFSVMTRPILMQLLSLQSWHFKVLGRVDQMCHLRAFEFSKHEVKTSATLTIYTNSISGRQSRH